MRMFTRSNRLTYICDLCAVTCLVTAGAFSADCQEPSSATMTQSAAQPPMAFDGVVFYPDTSADNGNGFLWWGIPNYWGLTNISSLNLIANAYGLGMHQVIGLPGWAEADRY